MVNFQRDCFNFLIIKIDLNIYPIVCSIIMSSEEKPKTIYYFDEDPGYETLQKITQGYFEVLKLMDGRDMFLNETGRYNLPLNEEASNMFKFKIYGNIAIVGKVTNDN